MGDTPVRIQELILEIFIQEHHPLVTENYQAGALSHRRIFFRECVVYAEVHHGAIGEGHYGPSDVMLIKSRRFVYTPLFVISQLRQYVTLMKVLRQFRLENVESAYGR